MDEGMKMTKKSIIALALLMTAILIIGCGEEEEVGAIIGQVVDQNGNPIGGATITTEPPTVETFTESDGSYEIKAVEEGFYTVRATKEGIPSGEKYVEVKSDEEGVADIMIFLPLLGNIVGRVVDATGNPIAGATVTTVPPTSTVTTDSSGEYKISDVESGEYTIRAENREFVDTRTATVEAGKVSTVDFSLTERAIAITSPQDGAQVDRMTQVTGKAEGIAEDTEIVVYVVWTGEPNVRYKQDQVGKVRNKEWTTQVVIGREQDIGKKFTIQAELPNGSVKSNIVAVTRR